jgi:hypothetical protein
MELGKLINMQTLVLNMNKMTGTPPFAHFALFGALVTKDLPFALVGEIPREMCQCVRLTYLNLGINQLAGMFQQNN